MNVIELIAELRDLYEFDELFFATPRPMVDLLKVKGLRYIPARDAYQHLSLEWMRALSDAVKRKQPDLIHVWVWWQCLGAYCLQWHLLVNVHSYGCNRHVYVSKSYVA